MNMGFVKNTLKVGVGLYAAKLAAASNGDEKTWTDSNVNRFLAGGVASIYATPRIKATLDKFPFVIPCANKIALIDFPEPLGPCKAIFILALLLSDFFNCIFLSF